MEARRSRQNIVQNSMETDGKVWNTLETTVSYNTWARLTPTLTHVVTYELATSGAEDDAMSSAREKDILYVASLASLVRTHTELLS